MLCSQNTEGLESARSGEYVVDMEEIGMLKVKMASVVDELVQAE